MYSLPRAASSAFLWYHLGGLIVALVPTCGRAIAPTSKTSIRRPIRCSGCFSTNASTSAIVLAFAAPASNLACRLFCAVRCSGVILDEILATADAAARCCCCCCSGAVAAVVRLCNFFLRWAIFFLITLRSLPLDALSLAYNFVKISSPSVVDDQADGSIRDSYAAWPAAWWPSGK